MKLTYAILWFDNSQDFFDSLDCDELTNAIRSWGFEPQITFETDATAFMSHSPFANVDLIVVDYDLGETTHGETFIRNIRDNNVLTEVVFYSNNASKELWQAIAEKELEGVYVANRGGILARIERVARQSVNKILDLNNMRGMLMAEVGDIDLILDQLFTASWTVLKTVEQEQLVNRFKEKALEQVTQMGACLQSLHVGSNVNEILDACDSNKRWQNFNRLKRYVPALKQCDPGDYPAEILSPRNFLAHGQSRQEDGVHVFSYRGREYRFDEAEGVRLRGRICEYKAVLQQALRTITGH